MMFVSSHHFLANICRRPHWTFPLKVFTIIKPLFYNISYLAYYNQSLNVIFFDYNMPRYKRTLLGKLRVMRRKMLVRNTGRPCQNEISFLVLVGDF